MRILHIANFSWFSARSKRYDDLGRYYTMDRELTNGLIRNEHCVWTFSYRDAARYLSPAWRKKKWGVPKMNDAVLALAKQFSPELILLGHGELLYLQTLATLRDILPSCKIVQWWGDWFTSRALEHLRPQQPYLDAFFATTAPSYYRPLLGDNPAPSYFLPNIVDSSIATGRAFARAEYDYDVFFAGRPAPERADILQKIEQLPDTRVGLFGFGGRLPLFGASFVAAVGTSRIGLNLSRVVDIPMYSSSRLTQLTGNGCLVLTPRTPGMTLLFTDDEVAYFDGAEELTEQLARYLDDDAARRQKAEAGWRRAHASYNERRVARFIVEATFGGEFSEEYEWVGESLV